MVISTSLAMAMPSPYCTISPNVLPGERFSGMKLKVDRFEGIRVQGHFNIHRFTGFRPAVDVKTDLPVTEAVGGRLVGGYHGDGHLSPDKGGQEVRERPPPFRGVFCKHRLEHVIMTDVDNIVSVFRPD
jgi:hypothetical protein